MVDSYIPISNFAPTSKDNDQSSLKEHSQGPHLPKTTENVNNHIRRLVIT